MNKLIQFFSRQVLFALVFLGTYLGVLAEGTQQFMPNSTDRLWLEFNIFSNNGTYGIPAEDRINVFLKKGEKLYIGMAMQTSKYANNITNGDYVDFKVFAPSGKQVFYKKQLPKSGDNGYIAEHSQAKNGPNGIKINGVTVTGGYTPIVIVAKETGNYYFEFQTYKYTTYRDESDKNESRFALKFFDATVTDASGNLITNPGAPNIPAGRLWSKNWVLTNADFGGHAVKTDFYVFTNDEFINKVEYEIIPYSFSFLANSFGVRNDADLNFVEKAQSQDGDKTDGNTGEYRIFLNDPDRNQWINTKLPPPEVKVWFEGELIYDYDYDREPALISIPVDNFGLEKNRTTCPYADIAVFKIETNMDGFTALLMDIDGNGYSTDGNDRALYLELKKGLNYVLWDCKNDNGIEVADGSFTASATFLGRGPAHFPIYDVERVDRIVSHSIRPFNKIGPTLYWDDRKLTKWGDPTGNMDETAESQLQINTNIPRTWTYDKTKPGTQHNGNNATTNTWYNAIDLGIKNANFTINTNSYKCVDGSKPYVGNIFLRTKPNINYDYEKEDFEAKFFDPAGRSMKEIKILSLPQHGYLKYNGSNVYSNTTISASNINKLVYIPDTDFSGKDFFKWEAKNSLDATTINKDTVFMYVNSLPTITGIVDKKVCVNEPIRNISFTIDDEETDFADLNVIAFSGDLKMVRNNKITVKKGTGGQCTVDVNLEPNKSGKAIVYLMVDDGLDYSIETFTIYVEPSLEIIGDTTICYGASLELTAVERGADSYSWSKKGSSGVSSTTREFNINNFQKTDEGIYTLSVKKGKCNSHRDIEISLSPIVKFTGDVNLCKGETLSLSADETNGTYRWKKIGYYGSTTVSTSKVFEKTNITYSDDGTYQLTVVKEGCQATSEEFTISVIDKPNLNLTLQGSVVSLGEPGIVIVKSAQSGVTYNAYIKDELVGSVVGSYGNAEIQIPANKLQIGDNEVIVKASNANCELEMDAKTVVTVKPQGVTVKPTAITVTEGGTPKQYTIVLDAQPASSVTVNINPQNTEEITVVNSVTFTTSNWNVPKIITVTSVNDDIDDGTIIFDIEHEVVSSDNGYNGIDVDNVTVTSQDDGDAAGIIVTSALSNTKEDGTETTFTVALQSQPISDVTIQLETSNPAEGLFLKGSSTTSATLNVLFTKNDWGAKTITLQGQPDDFNDGDVQYYIKQIGTNTADPKYAFDQVHMSNMYLYNINTNTSEVLLTDISGNKTTEASGYNHSQTAVFKLSCIPGTLGHEKEVTFNLSSTDPGEGQVSPTSVTLNKYNWDTGVEVTITGQDDQIADGDISYTIETSNAESGDSNYDGLIISNLSFQNIDDDVASITVSPLTLNIQESGSPITATYTIKLNSQPSGLVVIKINSTDETEGVVLNDEITFDAGNWQTPKTVTVTAVDDDIADGKVRFTIENSIDANATLANEFKGIDPDDVVVYNKSMDDYAGLEVTQLSSETSEFGGTATFNVRLGSEPVGEVKIDLVSSDETEGKLNIKTYTFNSTNWNENKEFIVTGQNDNIQDGSIDYTVTITPSSTTDNNYNVVSPETLKFTNTDDNDMAGVIIEPTTGLITAENGTTATFSVKLQSEPTHNVVIEFTSGDPTEGLLPSATTVSLTFTPNNWNKKQNVTVKGVHDDEADGDQTYKITSEITTDDEKYKYVTTDDIRVTNKDGNVAGIAITEVTNITTEAGGEATFVVSLASKPTSDVTLNFVSSDDTEGYVSVPSSKKYVFNASNWNKDQTVTIKGKNDNIDDGDISYNINISATSSDVKYNGLTSTYSVTNIDDDDAQIIITPMSLVTTEESGSSHIKTFSVKLATEPTATVEIPIVSLNTQEGVVSSDKLIFNKDNYSSAQPITVTAVDDNVVDGDVTYTIEVQNPSTTLDEAYNKIATQYVTVTNQDNDKAEFIVSPTSVQTTESGGTATFTVKLASKPSKSVYIPVSSSNTTEGIVSVSRITIHPDDWKTGVEVTVTGIDDDYDDGDQTYTIILGNSESDDANYNGTDVADVKVTNVDDEIADIIVSPKLLTTSEPNNNAQFNIRLGSKPLANVQIGLKSSDVTEGTVPASITLTPANWKEGVNVVVTAVNDDIQDGDKKYTIIVEQPSSSDNNYNVINPSDVSVTNNDDDKAGVTITPINNLVTNEEGKPAEFSVVLHSEPTHKVVINLNSNDESEGKVDKTKLEFTAGNWNIPQKVTITGQDDFIQDGNIEYSIITQNIESNDSNYKGMVVDDVQVINNDDDDQAGFVLSPKTGLITTEATGTTPATFTIVLTSMPTSQVSIPIVSNNKLEGVASPNIITFEPSEWNIPQEVTVTGVDDLIDDANQTYYIVAGKITSSDENYPLLAKDSVQVSNIDDDEAGITVSDISGNTTEDGGEASFTVKLNSEPLSNVVIDFSSDDISEGKILNTNSRLTFTPKNFNDPQTITVKGQDDNFADGNIFYNIISSKAQSNDPRYKDRSVADVRVVNEDNDEATVDVKIVGGNRNTYEANATEIVINVKLTSEPTSEVKVLLSTSDNTEGEIFENSEMIFDKTNWNQVQTAKLKGVNDDVDDDDVKYSLLWNVESEDVNYAIITGQMSGFKNIDDDKAGVTISKSTLTTYEEQSKPVDRFTIVLNSEPTEEVMITLTMNPDNNEGVLSETEIYFYPDDWNEEQMILVQGVDDYVADGNQKYDIVFTSESDDAKYNAMTINSTKVTNIDNDNVGFVITETGNKTETSESGTTDEFTVVLTCMPQSKNVVIDITGRNDKEHDLSNSSLTFTKNDWNKPQKVTITGKPDNKKDGDQTYNLTFKVKSGSDNQYVSLASQTISVTNKDIDKAGLRLSNISNDVSEDLTTATFTVRLNSEPSSNVELKIQSNNTKEGTVTPATWTILPSKWKEEKEFTVTGVDDFIHDGNTPFAITITATSLDTDYNTSANVSVVNVDNDTIGLKTTDLTAMETTEEGGNVTFKVVSTCEPQGNVVIDINSSNETEGVVSPKQVTLDKNNWKDGVEVTVTGKDDYFDDGNQKYVVSLVVNDASTTDNEFDSQKVGDIKLTNIDNDQVGLTFNVDTVRTSETGTTAEFTVKLSSKPYNPVTIDVASSNEFEGVIDINKLRFVEDEWNNPVKITVTGVDDNMADGDIVYDIEFSNFVSVDKAYENLTTIKQPAKNSDDRTLQANNDNAEGEENVNIGIDILSNDVGYDNGIKAINITKEPEHGIYKINSDKTILYTPNKDYYGDDSFVYELVDNIGQKSSADVAITINSVNNYIPLPKDDFRGASKNETIVVDVLFNDEGLGDGDIKVSVDNLKTPNGKVAIKDNKIQYTPDIDYLGKDVFTYKVTDHEGDEGTATVTITVKAKNYNPIAVDDYVTTTKNKSVNINVLKNDKDLYDGLKDISIYTLPLQGNCNVNFNKTFTYTPKKDFVGKDSLTYIITDTEGDYSLAKVYITVKKSGGGAGDYKLEAVNDKRATSKGQAKTINVLLNDIVEAGIDELVIKDNPNKGGTVEVNGDNTITYTPKAEFLGFEHFFYTIKDAKGQTDDAKVTVNVKTVNYEPQAFNDTVEVYIGETKVIHVLNNDTGFEDGIGDITIYKNPELGRAEVNTDNTISYTYESWATNITDSLIYVVSDGDGDVSLATVILKIVEKPNAKPEAVDDFRGAKKNEIIFVDVLDNDRGLDDKPITLSVLSSPANGDAEVNTADNTIKYTPEADFMGKVTFNYKVEDVDGDSDEATVTVNVKLKNANPEAKNDTVTTYMNTAVIANVVRNDIGLEDGVKVVLLKSNKNEDETELQTQHGMAKVNYDNTITYTPFNWYKGKDEVRYKVVDTDGDFSIATLYIDIVEKENSEPFANKDSVGAIVATPRIIDVLLNDMGIDDVPLTLTSGVPSHGTVVVNADNTITYTSDANYIGKDVFKYRVTDKDGEYSEAFVNVKVKLTNDIPVANRDTVTTFVNKPVVVNVLRNDEGLADGLAFVEIITQGMNGKAKLNSDNTIKYIPYLNYYGVDSIQYKVIDVDGDWGVGTLEVKVIPEPNYIPVAVDDRRGATKGTDINVDVLFNDKGLGDGVEKVVLVDKGVLLKGAVKVDPVTKTHFIYTAPNELITEDFWYKIIDKDGEESNVAKVTITVKDPNHQPVAVKDYAKTYKEKPVTINILKNDTGLEDGLDSMCIFIQPTNGTVVINSNRTVTYTPYNHYIGKDVFTYFIEDTEGDYAIAKVNIDITEKPDFIPDARDDRRGATINTPRTMNVLVNDKGLEDGVKSVSEERKPKHGTITVNGDFTVIYTPEDNFLGFDTFAYRVADVDNQWDTATVTVNVKVTNDIPIAFNDKAQTMINKKVDINVLNNDKGLSDGGLKVTIYNEDKLINGTVVVNSDNTITYIPAPWYIGKDEFEYMVEDVDGDMSIAKVVVDVVTKIDYQPVANDDRRGTKIGEAVDVDVLFNDTGLEDTPIHIDKVSGPVPSQGTIVVHDDTEPKTITFTPKADFEGLATFQYKVWDKDNQDSTAFVTVNVKKTNKRPIAVADHAETYMNKSVTLNVLANDKDLHDGGITVNIRTPQKNGTVVINADKTITYTPSTWWIGTDKFEYVVEDIDGDKSVAEVTIDVLETPNFVPDAIDDRRGVVKNKSRKVDVLFNDLYLEDVPITVAVVDAPEQEGLAEVDLTNNTILYTPKTNFLGEDRFTYSVIDKDGQGDTAIVTLVVKEENAIPLAVNDTAETIMNESVVVNVLNNDKGLSDGLSALSIIETTINGSAEPNADNTITYTPANWYIGRDSIVYKIEDADGDYSYATLVVTISERPNYQPVANDDMRGVSMNSEVDVDVLFNDTGLEDEPITVSIVNSVQPEYGTIQLNSVDNTIKYTPNKDEKDKKDRFMYRVTDANGDDSTAYVTITIRDNNTVPVAENDTALTVMNVPVNINVLDNDTGLDDGISHIEIYKQSLNGFAEVNFDNTIKFTPANWYHGYVEFVYTLYDVDGDKDTAVVRVEVRKDNSKPTASNDIFAVSEGKTLIVGTPGVLANDIDNDNQKLTPELVDQAQFGTVSLNENGSFTYIPNKIGEDVDKFTYRVTDGIDYSNMAIVTINITDVKRAPVAVNDTLTITKKDLESFINILENDTDKNGDSLIVNMFNGSTDGANTMTTQYGELTWKTTGEVNYTLDVRNRDILSMARGIVFTEKFTYDVTDGEFVSTAMLVINIINKSSDEVIIPKLFSPNGDLVEDVLLIDNMKDGDDNIIYIYNRWGTRVYHKEHYDNTWDGKSETTHKLLPMGTYYYSFFTKKDAKPIRGYIHIRY